MLNNVICHFGKSGSYLARGDFPDAGAERHGLDTTTGLPIIVAVEETHITASSQPEKENEGVPSLVKGSASSNARGTVAATTAMECTLRSEVHEKAISIAKMYLGNTSSSIPPPLRRATPQPEGTTTTTTTDFSYLWTHTAPVPPTAMVSSAFSIPPLLFAKPTGMPSGAGGDHSEHSSSSASSFSTHPHHHHHHNSVVYYYEYYIPEPERSLPPPPPRPSLREHPSEDRGSSAPSLWNLTEREDGYERVQAAAAAATPLKMWSAYNAVFNAVYFSPPSALSSSPLSSPSSSSSSWASRHTLAYYCGAAVTVPPLSMQKKTDAPPQQGREGEVRSSTTHRGGGSIFSVDQWGEELLWRLFSSLLSALALFHTHGFHFSGRIRLEDVLCFSVPTGLTEALREAMTDTVSTVVVASASTTAVAGRRGGAEQQQEETEEQMFDRILSLYAKAVQTSIMLPQCSLRPQTAAHQSFFVLTARPTLTTEEEEKVEASGPEDTDPAPATTTTTRRRKTAMMARREEEEEEGEDSHHPLSPPCFSSAQAVQQWQQQRDMAAVHALMRTVLSMASSSAHDNDNHDHDATSGGGTGATKPKPMNPGISSRHEELECLLRCLEQQQEEEEEDPKIPRSSSAPAAAGGQANPPTTSTSSSTSSSQQPSAVQLVQLQAIRLRQAAWIWQGLAEWSQVALWSQAAAAAAAAERQGDDTLRYPPSPRDNNSPGLRRHDHDDHTDDEIDKKKFPTSSGGGGLGRHHQRMDHHESMAPPPSSLLAATPERAAVSELERMRRMEAALAKREAALEERERKMSALLELYELTREQLDTLPGAEHFGYEELRKRLLSQLMSNRPPPPPPPPPAPPTAAPVYAFTAPQSHHDPFPSTAAVGPTHRDALLGTIPPLHLSSSSSHPHPAPSFPSFGADRGGGPGFVHPARETWNGDYPYTTLPPDPERLPRGSGGGMPSAPTTACPQRRTPPPPPPPNERPPTDDRDTETPTGPIVSSSFHPEDRQLPVKAAGSYMPWWAVSEASTTPKHPQQQMPSHPLALTSSLVSTPRRSPPQKYASLSPASQSTTPRQGQRYPGDTATATRTASSSAPSRVNATAGAGVRAGQSSHNSNTTATTHNGLRRDQMNRSATTTTTPGSTHFSTPDDGAPSPRFNNTNTKQTSSSRRGHLSPSVTTTSPRAGANGKRVSTVMKGAEKEKAWSTRDTARSEVKPSAPRLPQQQQKEMRKEEPPKQKQTKKKEGEKEAAAMMMRRMEREKTGGPGWLEERFSALEALRHSFEQPSQLSQSSQRHSSPSPSRREKVSAVGEADHTRYAGRAEKGSDGELRCTTPPRTTLTSTSTTPKTTPTPTTRLNEVDGADGSSLSLGKSPLLGAEKSVTTPWRSAVGGVLSGVDSAAATTTVNQKGENAFLHRDGGSRPDIPPPGQEKDEDEDEDEEIDVEVELEEEYPSRSGSSATSHSRGGGGSKQMVDVDIMMTHLTEEEVTHVAARPEDSDEDEDDDENRSTTARPFLSRVYPVETKAPTHDYDYDYDPHHHHHHHYDTGAYPMLGSSTHAGTTTTSSLAPPVLSSAATGPAIITPMSDIQYSYEEPRTEQWPPSPPPPRPVQHGASPTPPLDTGFRRRADEHISYHSFSAPVAGASTTPSSFTSEVLLSDDVASALLRKLRRHN